MIPYEPNIQFNRNHPLAFDSGWLMQGSGERVKEYANGYDGTIIGADRVQEGVEFGTSLSRIKTVNAGKLLTNKGSIVLSFIWKLTPSSSYAYLIAIDEDYQEFSLYLSNNVSMLRCYINGVVIQVSQGNLVDGNIHNIAITWNSSNNEFNFFYDGNLQLNFTTSLTWDTIGIAAHDFYIGGRLSRADRYAGGIFSYCYIYNRVLSPQEILQLNYNPYDMFYTPSYTTYYSFPTISFKPMIIGPY